MVHQKPELTIPAYTAYSVPNPLGLQISADGVTGWRDGSNHVVWYGHFENTGRLHVQISVALAVGSSATLQVQCLHRKSQNTVTGRGIAAPVNADFGEFQITRPGYVPIVLSGLAKSGPSFGRIGSLTISGDASDGAHFNTAERRNSASVHLFYPTPAGAGVDLFYNEVTPVADPLWTYYMACGFDRGYFGIQVNSPTERRIIFSVWDAGNEAVSRSKVAQSNRVTLLAKGDGVYAGSFGNEGTGGHSHLVFPWLAGKTYRLAVTAKVEGDSTIYTAWFWFPDPGQWRLIARFSAPHDGHWLRGLYSFDEDFGGDNGNLPRLARFGGGWLHTTDGKWLPLTEASFSHDGTGKTERKDYGGGVSGNRFYLATGGFIKRPPVHYGEPFSVRARRYPPSDLAGLLPR
ncbi:MAG: DUF3472 domain-containing protein [Armatimonadetes bacterium]|nr:DUF3472 domain-containing protein [Armatimonadota bacterium]MDE2205650.1 DUF3472 domain-containing protein [Armatimonadota bacterium]